jgi:NADH:ubiquinone oxidoreductase subunit 6 (subunit J)
VIVFLVLIAVFVLAAGLVFLLGAGLVAVIPLLLAVAVVGWMIWAFMGSRSPGEATRQVEPAQLLGPGGPDDPDNTANHGGEPVGSRGERA